MKYISVKSVVEAYKGFQDCMTNKSWGYLALLKTRVRDKDCVKNRVKRAKIVRFTLC